MAKALTQFAIENIRRCPVRREIPDKIPGLYLVAQPSGKKSWAFRYRFHGIPRKYTIGPYPAIGLKEARALASATAASIGRGQDPALIRSAAKARARLTAQADHDLVEAVIEQFIEKHARAKTRASTAREIERCLRKEVIPRWRGRHIQEIKRRHVLDMCDELLAAGKPTMANRLFSTVRRLFTWCIERGILEVSPIAGLPLPSPEVPRDRVLNDAELKALWEACEGVGSVFGPIVRLLILTGARRDEVAGIRWLELDLEAKTWTLPRERAKNNTEHVIPLSEQALVVLNGLIPDKRKDGLLFTTTGETPVSGFSKPRARLDAMMRKQLGTQPVLHWTFHDIRRSVASGLARLGQPVHVTEAVLNHRSGIIKGVARIYNRYDYAKEKAQALEAWGRYVEALVSDKPADNVVELATARG